jgi:hypothetical protein
MRRMRTGRDAAPEGSASSAGPPGASGDTARPNYMGPSGNGLVGADERGGKPAESRAYHMGAPVRFQKAVSRSKEKRRGEAPIGAPVRVMGRLLPSAEGTGPTARRPRCGVPHSACRRFAPSVRGHFPNGGRAPTTPNDEARLRGNSNQWRTRDEYFHMTRVKLRRHARACRGHPRLALRQGRRGWPGQARP